MSNDDELNYDKIRRHFLDLFGENSALESAFSILRVEPTEDQIAALAEIDQQYKKSMQEFQEILFRQTFGGKPFDGPVVYPTLYL